jgi:peptide/nickel transport system substrate-binding protein
LQAGLAEAGIALDIVPGEGKQTLTSYRARRHDIVLGQWDPDYLDPHANAAAFARNPDNGDAAADKTLAWRNGWAIPEITALTDRALLEAEPAKRLALYRDLQERLREDSPFIILYQDTELIAARREIEGLRAGVSADQTYYHGLRKNAAASVRQ